MSLHARRMFCNKILRFSASVSLEITTGAGGLAISPKLEFHALVPWDSPAFQLIWDAYKNLILQSNASTIQETHRKLFELFDEKRALQSDTLADGNTILHVGACFTRKCAAFILSIRETAKIPFLLANRGLGYSQVANIQLGVG